MKLYALIFSLVLGSFQNNALAACARQFVQPRLAEDLTFVKSSQRQTLVIENKGDRTLWLLESSGSIGGVTFSVLGLRRIKIKPGESAEIDFVVIEYKETSYFPEMQQLWPRYTMRVIKGSINDGGEVYFNRFIGFEGVDPAIAVKFSGIREIQHFQIILNENWDSDANPKRAKRKRHRIVFGRIDDPFDLDTFFELEASY